MSNVKYLRLQMREGRDVAIDLPVSASADVPSRIDIGSAVPAAPERQETVLRTLDKKYFRVRDAVLGEKTEYRDGILTIRESKIDEIISSIDNLVDLKVDIIHPDELHTYTDTIMDIQPIATKSGEDMLGTGTTFVLDGVVIMLTGVTEAGVQVGEFGSSEGYIDENVILGRPGAPDKGDILIHVHAVIPAGMNMERPGPFAAHSAANELADEIRRMMKEFNAEDADRTEHFEHVAGRKHRILIIKEIMGQGAMHDHIILPNEPIGIMGGVSNIDLGNLGKG